GRDVAR
ncbi:phage minor tail protein L, partial [Escherichia coli EC1847]